MTELEQVSVRIDVLQRRVSELEKNVRPLISLEGVDVGLLCDQALVSAVAEAVGSTLRVVNGKARTREASTARACVAKILHGKAGWGARQIARNLGCSHTAVLVMLTK